MAFRTDQTWVGLGIKGGGHLAVIGAETMEGAAGRLDQFTTSVREFNISSIRFGPGLGGSVGVSVMAAFNVPTLQMLENKTLTPSLSDFNINLAVPEFKASSKTMIALSKLGASLSKSSSKFLTKAVIGGLKPGDVATLRDFAHIYWQTVIEGKEADSSNAIKIIVLDIPSAGIGLEASLFWTLGEIHVS
jgi:hypothetical protein